MANQSKTLSIYLLIFLMLFQGISGILGGIGLVMDPSGETLQIPISWLNNSPFSNYLIPGIILLILLGIFPVIISIGIWTKTPWSWLGALTISLALIIWIGVEIIIIGYQPEPPLQLIYGTLGLVLLILVFLPAVRQIRHK